MKSIRISVLIFLTFCTAARGEAPLRGPTPAESRVLKKVVEAIGAVLDSFESPDWHKTDDWYHGKLLCASHPDRPLDVDSSFDRTYEVPGNSNRFKTLLRPWYEKAQKESDWQKRLTLTEHAQSLQKIRVWVYVNRRTVRVPSQSQALSVPGAAFVYRVDKASELFCDDHLGPCYLIGFGKWPSYTRSGTLIEFPFTHPRSTPYVENVVVRINGAEDRLQDLLRTVNWQRLNRGLTL